MSEPQGPLQEGADTCRTVLRVDAEAALRRLKATVHPRLRSESGMQVLSKQPPRPPTVRSLLPHRPQPCLKLANTLPGSGEVPPLLTPSQTHQGLLPSTTEASQTSAEPASFHQARGRETSKNQTQPLHCLIFVCFGEYCYFYPGGESYWE